MPSDGSGACKTAVSQEHSAVTLGCLQSRSSIRQRPPLTIDNQAFAQRCKAVYDRQTVAQRAELGQRRRVGSISIPSRVDENRAVAVDPGKTRKVAVSVRWKTGGVAARRKIPQHQGLR